MRLPRQLFIVTGITAIIGAIALGGLSFTAPGAFAGNGCPPTSTPDPVPTGTIVAGIIAFGEVCETPTEDEPNATFTPTTGPTEAPEPTEPVATTAPSTPVPPPAATSTPSGGAGAGGVQPPSTGTGGADGATGVTGMWVLAAFGLLAGGLGSLAYGMRRS